MSPSNFQPAWHLDWPSHGCFVLNPPNGWSSMRWRWSKKSNVAVAILFFYTLVIQHSNEISPFSIGNTSISNGGCSIAMLVYWRVNLLKPLGLPNFLLRKSCGLLVFGFFGGRKNDTSSASLFGSLKGKKINLYGLNHFGWIFFPICSSSKDFPRITAFFTSNLPNVLRWRSFLYAYINHINCIQVSFSRGEWRAKEGPQRN